jgi:uncharacterized FAD-dependent dehydrogenase
VLVSGGGYQDASAVVLATGHSSRALMQELAAAGVSLLAKPFAMGFRVEHPQVPAACMTIRSDSASGVSMLVMSLSMQLIIHPGRNLA